MPERQQQLQNWLARQCGLDNFDIQPASGDASFRRYFRVSLNDGTSLIAMDAPPDKENSEPFVRLARRFGELGLHVPDIIEEDLEQGFLLLKDLGSTQYLEVLSTDNVDIHYGDALFALNKLQTSAGLHELPDYSQQLLMNEMELFREWLLKKQLGVELSDAENHSLDSVFKLLADNALEQPKVCVHRDYHSRNLMVVPDDIEGPTPGILDFQDAVAGPITYDLVSLLKDCYIAWPRQQVVDWAMAYCQTSIQSGLVRKADENNFLRWFDLMGVQRHLKAAGIFARLNIRDGKEGYLKDIPRTVGYITQLQDVYPELSDLIAIIERHIQVEI